MARKPQNGKDIKVEWIYPDPEGKDSSSDDRIWRMLAELLAKGGRSRWRIR